MLWWVYVSQFDLFIAPEYSAYFYNRKLFGQKRKSLEEDLEPNYEENQILKRRTNEEIIMEFEHFGDSGL